MTTDQSPLSVRDRAKTKLQRGMGSELLAHLADARTVEILLNEDGQLWLERLGEPMRCVGTLRAAQGRAIIETVAGYHGKEITYKRMLTTCATCKSAPLARKGAWKPSATPTSLPAIRAPNCCKSVGCC